MNTVQRIIELLTEEEKEIILGTSNVPSIEELEFLERDCGILDSRSDLTKFGEQVREELCK